MDFKEFRKAVGPDVKIYNIIYFLNGELQHNLTTDKSDLERFLIDLKKMDHDMDVKVIAGEQVYFDIEETRTFNLNFE